MSIEKDLRKDGIEVIETLDSSSAISIAKNVSEKIYSAFPNYEFTYEYLFDTLSGVTLYMAEIPEGLSEASYFYKNSSIYFRNGMGIKDIEKYSVHEYIHHLQTCIDSKGHLVRMGLCEFNGSKITGIALNEAAVQIVASNVLDCKFENVEYYGITFPTISQNVYPIICNLVAQMAYVTGEDVLFESTLDSNDHFKNKFIALCGKKAYNQVLINLDKILDTEEKIIITNNILQSSDLKENKAKKMMNKVSLLKNQIKQLYFETQNLIITSYSETMYENLISIDDIDNFRKTLYNCQDLIGSSPENKDFNDFYIKMMDRLEVKAEEFMGNTYLMPKAESTFMRMIRFIKNLISARRFNIDINKEE